MKILKVEKIELSENLEKEIEIFDKLKKVIDSCITLDQLDNAGNAINNIERDYLGIANALKYVFYAKLSELKKAELEIREIELREKAKI